MADARIFHKKGSHGERIIGLDHLAFRVWHQYVLSADDYGVMRESASVLRADNPKLESEPFRRVERALSDVVASELVHRFTHQGVSYLWQLDWQDFQQIRYPRDTVLPSPSPEELANATVLTQKLFALRVKPSRERLRNVSETDPIPVRGGGRQTLTQTQTPSEDLSDPEESARETTAIAPRWSRNGRTPGLVADLHMRCYRSPACARGVCVPVWLATEWRQQYGDDTAMADVEIGSVITTALAALPPSGPIGDTPKDFWRAVWKAAHGSQAPASGVSRSKGQLTLDAARRFVLSRMQATGAAS